MTFDIRAFLARIEGILGNLPGFVAPLVGISLAILIALGVHALAFQLIVQRIDERHRLTASLVRRSRRPLRLASALLALVLFTPMVRLPHALGTHAGPYRADRAGGLDGGAAAEPFHAAPGQPLSL